MLEYNRQQLRQLDTIEQAWDGDELKISTEQIRVWLTTNENRQYNGDYTVELYINGKWEQQ